MRNRWPLRTTRPLFDQPLLALSARTATLIVKNVGEALGLVVLGLLLVRSGCELDRGGCDTGSEVLVGLIPSFAREAAAAVVA